MIKYEWMSMFFSGKKRLGSRDRGHVEIDHEVNLKAMVLLQSWRHLNATSSTDTHDGEEAEMIELYASDIEAVNYEV